MRLETGSLYEFGPFLLDTAQHLLTRQGNPVSLTPKTYDLLHVLVTSGGRMMRKDELLKAVWPDAFVEVSNLTQQISAVRKALGENAGEDRYIVTVPGRGYRFAAQVKSAEPNAPIHPHRTRKLALVAGLALAIAALALLIQARIGQSRPRILAILPFQNLKSDPE